MIDLVRWVTRYGEWPGVVSDPVQWVTYYSEWTGTVSDPVQWSGTVSDPVLASSLDSECIIQKEGQTETRAPTLWRNPCTTLKTNYWSCNIVHVKQNYLILTYANLRVARKNQARVGNIEMDVFACKSYEWYITPARPKWIAVENSNNPLTWMFKTQRS